jgi:hypothetical protein
VGALTARPLTWLFVDLFSASELMISEEGILKDGICMWNKAAKILPSASSGVRDLDSLGSYAPCTSQHSAKSVGPGRVP